MIAELETLVSEPDALTTRLYIIIYNTASQEWIIVVSRGLSLVKFYRNQFSTFQNSFSLVVFKFGMFSSLQIMTKPFAYKIISKLQEFGRSLIYTKNRNGHQAFPVAPQY